MGPKEMSQFLESCVHFWTLVDGQSPKTEWSV